MAAFIVVLNVLGWGVLTLFVVPEHYSIGNAQVFGVGLGVTAFTLGMRHAFDVDHIAAIDNATRKLIADGQRPLTVGFWFSLGHSTIVFALCLLLSFGVRALTGELENDSSALHQVTGVVGVSVSGVFLCLIGLINLVVLVGIVKVFRGIRAGEFTEEQLEDQLNKRGFLNRILGRATAAVRKPWHIYPVGLLFGLGFDTATEVGLLVLAGGAAAFSLPWYAILVLPVLFAAGMTLFDAADGVFMHRAYDWAFAQPVRKIFYNITVTALSVLIALLIGGIELISVLTAQLGITSGPLAAIANINLDYAGYAIVGLFVLTWLVALVVWRVGRIEERWAVPAD
ncbi:HoxN/HupN/NixA family nickel/cobalt transporter [Amycolatopsis sp. RM579]|uniref:Nickel/cobalt efflux system n=2 Tax=Amycolatopsis pithecellobii TaxID=664692 RepID=A0A6N7Z9Q5_9PSEU|nr:HoxN/HupN/NixA family nickel/cobalt transporter [Amycolatopsis pithecellobii]